MADFFKLAGYDYDELSGIVYVYPEDDGISLYVNVYAKTKNEQVPSECQKASLEQIDGIFLKVKSLQELVGRKLVWEEASNEYGNAGALNVIECEMINNAELTIEGIENGCMTVYWKGHGDIRRKEPFNVDVPFETRVTIPISDSESSDASDSVVLPHADRKEEGHMNPSGSNSAEYSLPVETYKSFIRQMADWYSGGELPTAAGQDLRFILELQKQKLHALGLDIKCELPKKGAGRNNVTGIYYSDRIFTNSILGGDVNVTRSVVSTQDQRCLNASDVSLVTMVLEPKNGSQPDDGMTLCCPNCGAPSTLGELQAGCKHCGTRFLMSELYPKVMNYNVHEHEDEQQRKRKNIRDLIRLSAVCTLPLMIYSIILILLDNQYNSAKMSLFSAIFRVIFGGVLGGAMFGGLLFGGKKLLEVLGLMGKGLRGGGHTVSTLLNANKIKTHDPEFSSEYFRDKAIALFRMAVYSKDATELACCQCRCPGSAADIIEAQLFNFNISSCKITDGVCDADLTLYLDCLHYKKGQVISKSDKFRMHVRKKLRTATNPGFSFAAVSCPSCGASFDARNVKACPFCNNAYLHEEHDWVMTDLH